MSKPTKWAKHSEPTTPITIVAQESLEYRLSSVWRYAPLAAKRADEDVEYVHQLRVCVRRANAAIELYAPLLAGKTRRKLRKQLRALRRAAGPARDLDVLADRLSRIDSATSAKGLESFRDLVAVQRKRSQKPLKRSYRKAKRRNFVENAKKLVRSVKWRRIEPEPDFETFARMTFQPIIDRFFAAGQGDLRDIDALHQMRIEGKTVRYAMELLSPAFEEPFREQIYPIFAKVQDKLGSINDHASAISFYRDLLDSAGLDQSRAIIEQMLDLEVTELQSSRLAFLKWWTPARIARMQSQFDAVLQPASHRPTTDHEV